MTVATGTPDHAADPVAASLATRLLERDLLPDVLIRAGIRRLVARRLAGETGGTPEQRQQRHRDGRAVDARKHRAAAMFRQRGPGKRHAEPREHRQRQVAVDLQCALEAFLDRLRDLRLEAVDVDEGDQRDQRHDQQRQHHAKPDQDLLRHAVLFLREGTGPKCAARRRRGLVPIDRIDATAKLVRRDRWPRALGLEEAQF